MCDSQPDDHYVQGKSETCELMRQNEENLCLALTMLLSKDPHNSPDTVQVKLLQDPSQTAMFRK